MRANGLLLLDKPVGMSSNQALSAAKRLLGINKAGHAGTLDPFASGMLVCAFGRATRVNAYLLEDDKTYQAEMQVGTATSTGDPEGEVCARAEVPRLSLQQWQALADQLTGNIEQIPPMYSALKHQGQRLYALARQGIVIERQPRPVQILHFRIDDWQPPQLQFSVRCGKGTYIRTLAQQLAELAGSLGYLTALRRTGCGSFQARQMVTLEQLQSAEDPFELLLSVDTALQDLCSVQLDAQQARRFCQGQAIAPGEVPPAVQQGNHGALLRIYADREFIGIAVHDPAGKLRPKRLF